MRQRHAASKIACSMLATTGDVAITVLITLSIIVPLLILVAVCWLFFRSARRFDHDRAQAKSEPDGQTP
jgi:hypothetical protein